MGKFARVIARTHDLTTDNIIDGSKALGRVTKKGLAPIGHKISDGITAVKVEHVKIERERQIKQAAKARAEALEAELFEKLNNAPIEA